MTSVASVPSELNRLSGQRIVEMLRAGELSACEVLDAYAERIAKVNPALNALVVPLLDEARKTASSLDEAYIRREPLGPLHGLPITVKESIEVAGTPSTLGLTNRMPHRATVDAPQVAALKQAGAVLVGKTNVSLLLRAYETDNPVYGRTNNPWNLSRAPGGSSGGEGSLIAAGGAVLGLGSDLAGSIRLPAHACGVHGLRPTAGRLTMMGHARIHSKLLSAIPSQAGPISKNVADLKLAMSVLAAPGHEACDPSVPPVPWNDSVDVTKLRIGYYTDNRILTPAPAIQRAIRDAVRALQMTGAEVVEWQPPDCSEAWEIQLRLMCADGLASYRHALRNSKGGRVRLAAMPGSIRSLASLLAQVVGQRKLAAALRYKHRASLEQYSDLLGRRRNYSLRFLRALEQSRLDAIICPPDALPALRHGSSASVSACSISYPGLYSLLGMPCGVVAATRVRADEETQRNGRRDFFERAAHRVELGSVGLPVGVQVVGRHWREDVVLAVMTALEDHFRQQPDYPAWPEIPSEDPKKESGKATMPIQNR